MAVAVRNTILYALNIAVSQIGAWQVETLLTPTEVADTLQVPVATIHAWRYKGVGPTAIKVGRHLRWRPADIDKWLTAQTQSTP